MHFFITSGPDFKVHGYSFKGSNSAIFKFVSLVMKLESTLKGNNLLLKEQSD